MTSHNATALVELRDSDQVLADPRQDIRGRTAVDRDGDELGTVQDLLIDAEEGKVRFLKVEHGGVLGIGAKASFVPVDIVTRVENETVCVGESRGRVADAPGYDPELVDANDYFEKLYGYYGSTPYWASGYMYPGFPYRGL
ncbi:PRC-barrel domain-containing protein [Actinoplanes sp. N902-109]|uniref:PRC-barrel domain-containing protein n=1 Tax=Actinoplanes sp. (strain N902-109) TaxID=649831 RepID=UPI000329431D|nr:PRC-barrel domain-containing protein [Actinoplanes sp. N902-109]AGL16288.1 PRC-barrel domain-containing protein [Actinoplanes sp. N902-109]